MTEDALEHLSREEMLDLLRKLLRENASLKEELGRLRQENKKLRELVEEVHRQGKRQAAPFSKGPPKPDPQKCGRKPDAEYGMKTYRAPPAQIDEVYEAPLPGRCPECNGQIDFVQVRPQFQVEVPRKPIHRQFNVAVGHCRSCHKRIQGRHPLQTSDALGAAASQIGPEAQALAVLLNKDMGLSHGKISRLFRGAFAISLSRGGSAQVMLRAAERSSEAYLSILVMVHKSPVVYPDETGWKVAGLLHWLWTFVTANATAFVIRASRGFDVAEDVLGADYAGTLGHDGWLPYDQFAAARHQQCLGHLFRRCSHMLEVATRGAVRFPRQVKTLLKSALALRDRRDEGEISQHGLAVAVGRMQSRLDGLLASTRSNAVNERLAKHLRNHRDQILTFLRKPGVEATNWPAEQSIRPAVVNRKVWGGSRTDRGALAQATLMSVLRTCVQQGRDGLDFLTRTLRASSSRNLPQLFPINALG